MKREIKETLLLAVAVGAICGVFGGPFVSILVGAAVWAIAG